MAARRPRVAVVGGGIGGLAVALGLRRQGIEVVVHEQARELSHQGAGIAIGANGHRALRDLGLVERLAESAARPVRADFRHWRTGRSMVTHRLTGNYEKLYGAPFWTVERAAVQEALLAVLGPEHVRLGARCTTVEQTTDGAVLRFADGTEARADAVVGADGIHSAVRHHLFGPDAAVFSGTSGYRALVPMERLRHVPELAEPALWLWLGPGRHFIAYPVADGSALNFLAVVPDRTWTVESWSTEGDPGALLAAFDGWHPFVTEVLGACDHPGRWALYDREPQRTWSVGRVTLLGDAAHAMLPHHGQGANQALEDAVVLARLLAGTDAEGVAGALRAYEQLRRPRTRLIQTGSRKNAGCFQLPDGPEAEARNERLTGLPDDLAWIHGHDALDSLRAAPAPV
ncbi:MULTISPECIES: FAD-dependent monooxygenase [unclassified Streptomyces]|uniref:FAD-dependent monooxygenase n=1 Tax=unclassified Streptomyces TaxID=2593676 RepID=UPI000DAE66BB|nr:MULTISPECIES: FAD-dependent monooxygenase [unclassified Streptomyces]PZT77623.1 FAD-dependent monooxygenase [Streptomyces sp. AC1-42W]PZT78423.1 FAD-dependent monooxygenase [Streptomyces sp. AC1-42T]